MIDVAIIGGGPAALGAALYAARSGMSVTIFEKKFVGGQASTTYEIDNYLGFTNSPSGSELTEKMAAHVSEFDVKFRYNEVKELVLEGDTKKIITAKKEFEAKTIILAMGATPALLSVPGEKELTGKGVSYCATCDGMFFKDKTVCVVGGGNTAVEDAIYLSPLAQKVYIIHRRDEFRASPLLVERLKKFDNVEFVMESRITKINGSDSVESVTVDTNGDIHDIKTDALFVAVGTLPANELVDNTVTTHNGFIITDETMATNIPGVFAAGDIRKKVLRQVITAVADGAVAGEEASKYVNAHKNA
ncbi:MAG: thioredoxin-disulfide reductase [Clostridia bacterium]|nr:thioredoxin-disulfide reductase [Clostridia bacterium]